MNIRHATISDLPNLVSLFLGYLEFYRRKGDGAEIEAFLRDRIVKKDSVILVAPDDSGIANDISAFVQLYPSFSSLRMKPFWILNDLFVSPQKRQAGIVKRLIKAAEDFARDAGAAGLSLSTAHTNLPAQKLYEALGWKKDIEYTTYTRAL